MQRILAPVRLGHVLILLCISGIVGVIDPLFFTVGYVTTRTSLVAGMSQLLVFLLCEIALSHGLCNAFNPKRKRKTADLFWRKNLRQPRKITEETYENGNA
jgi:hypothetical protein